MISQFRLLWTEARTATIPMVTHIHAHTHTSTCMHMSTRTRTCTLISVRNKCMHMRGDMHAHAWRHAWTHAWHAIHPPSSFLLLSFWWAKFTSSSHVNAKHRTSERAQRSSHEEAAIRSRRRSRSRSRRHRRRGQESSPCLLLLCGQRHLPSLHAGPSPAEDRFPGRTEARHCTRSIFFSWSLLPPKRKNYRKSSALFR
jgi:hypothetical protein